jgi:glycosyltransferase involved in cell wall biosynthesis
MFMPAQSRFRHSVLRTVGDLLPGNPVLRRQRLLRQSAAIHALTEAEKSDIVTYLDIDPALIHVVPLGIAPQFFEATPDLFHERTGLRDVVLCVGSIEHRKNQMNVLTALSDIDRDVVFIGSPVKRADAADHAYHETFVQSVERHPRMHWFPAMRHGDPFLASAFAAAHVHILVSFIEAQGIVSLEAAAAGANIVVGDLPSQRELYGNTVVYADPASTQSIRSAVLNALARPRGSSPLPKNVLMTWDEVVTHFIEIYRSVV